MIAAGFIVHLSLGTVYTVGNLLPYVVSYTRDRSHPQELTSATGTWIAALHCRTRRHHVHWRVVGEKDRPSSEHADR